MPNKRLYFDCLNGVPVLPEVADAMTPWIRDWYSDAGAVHADGLRVRDALALARDQFASLIGCGNSEEIIFTSSGTEAINLAVKGCALASHRTGKHILATRVEHPAVLQSLEWLKSMGCSYDLIDVDESGRVLVDQVVAALSPETVLVCVQLANQDIGTIQPVAEVNALLKERGIPLCVDATYAAGWMPLNAEELGADLLAVAPYRFGGPKGVGVLFKSNTCRMQPLVHGGVQELGRRAGVENVPGIVGAGVAADALREAGESRFVESRRVQSSLWDGIKRRISNVRLNGPAPGEGRCPLGLNVSFEFTEGEGIALMSDVRGLAISSGSACISRRLQVSYVLESIGCPSDLAMGSVILSPGLLAEEGDVDAAVEILSGVVERLRSMSPQWESYEAGEIRSQITDGAK